MKYCEVFIPSQSALLSMGHQPLSYKWNCYLCDFISLTPSMYWEQNYVVRKDRTPIFLALVVQEVLNTGKYLNVVRLCGKLSFYIMVSFVLLVF